MFVLLGPHGTKNGYTVISIVTARPSDRNYISDAVLILHTFNNATAPGRRVTKYVLTTKWTTIGLFLTESHFMIIHKHQSVFSFAFL